MKQILVLGAGQSSPFLIRRLLERGPDGGFRVTVADTDVSAARARIGDATAGEAIHLDVSDPQARAERFDAADVVVNLLPPRFELPVAWSCVEHGVPMVTASYLDPAVRGLDGEARARGVLLLTEMGLDPGIDLMSTMEILDEVRAAGGRVVSYESYGSGVPAPESATNPLRYAITWNARNVVMAGQEGALYRRDGRLRAVTPTSLFRSTWPVEVPGVGEMEAYPNRDSLRYLDSFDLHGCPTVVRGTLRYRGWCETWHHVVRLGLPSETLSVPGLGSMTRAELVDAFLPDAPGDAAPAGDAVAARAARHLGLDPDGPVMERLRWLGLFDDEPVGADARTPAEALVRLLADRLTLRPDDTDLVILLHRIRWQRPDGRVEEVVSTMRERGEPGGMTAMARTVGLPIALAVERILDGGFGIDGVHIPTTPAVYRPLLAELAREGVAFAEERREVEAAAPARGAPAEGGR